jgi:hypothetical protein
MKQSVRVFGILGTALLAACDMGGDIVGEWQAALNEESTMKLTFAADSTFTMDTGSFIGEGRYFLEDFNLVLQPTGALATVAPGGYHGEVTDWTKMTVCSPSGVCTEFTKQ